MSCHLRRVLASLALLLGSARAQLVFVNGSAQIPATGSYTENVDFADVDLDGDWDAALADGGDSGNDQNRLYLNQGGLQLGTRGHFSDATAARFPVLAEDGRDIEFVDYDGDGDVDIGTANTSHLANQTNRFWTNTGAQQGGQPGFYHDETAQRWIGLGLPGSSVPPSAVLPNGGFIDWCCDVDYADLDADGDLDLFQSSYGASFSALAPARVFLNDGSGQFSEFNPSGYQLGTVFLPNGAPGLWCEGVQSPATLDCSGAQCDIAASPLDVELFDLDGDFDIDVLLGSRLDAPRLFANRIEPTGAPGFRDQTGCAFPAGYWSGSNNYAQEFGDLDRDGDLDLLGVDYPALDEAAYRNDSQPGALAFASMQKLPSSNNDDQEADLADYDGDGDLDVFVAAFASADRFYRNSYAGGPPGSYAFGFEPASGAGALGDRSLDSDCADVDGDGDYDQLCAEDANHDEILRLDVWPGAADQRAPRIPAAEALADAAPFDGTRAARAQVLEDASYYTSWYLSVALELEVGGCALGQLPARSSLAQIFRAELPANLLGSVRYRWLASDEHGNTGSSIWQTYHAPAPAGFFAPFGSGSPGSLGTPSLAALALPYPGKNFPLAAQGLPAGSSCLLYMSSQPLPASVHLPGLANLNLGGALLLARALPVGSTGCALLELPIPPGAPSGASVYAQAFGLGDGQGGDLLSATPGYTLAVP